MDIFKNLTILYIEGDSQCREQNALLMREIGLKVLETDNLESANNLFRQHKIDIILIDLNMHQKERMTFLQFLRYKDIIAPIIIIADDSDKEILLEAINLDTTRFLIKPLKKNELLHAIKIASDKLLPPFPAILVNNELNHGFSYDPINKSIIDPTGEPVQLSKKEYLLVELLLKNKRQIIPFDEIERVVWQNSSMSMDALRTLVRAIRKKTYSDIITNYSGIGYKMDF
ncbi:MAG: response regulator [Sulfuricurvum sp.]|nr:response regulator [Sulfuricurvum sp.]